MTSPTIEQSKLLNALSENSLIKAAVILDYQGKIKGQCGHASVLLTSNLKRAPGKKDNQTRENVYMVETSQDILMVVFEESTDFQRVRNVVDKLLGHFGLELVS